MKVHLRVFVEIENLGKVMNSLSKSGVTGFYIVEYKGISPQEWAGFNIKEDPESAIAIIKDHAQDAVQVCSVMDEENVEPIITELRSVLKGERFTIIEIPIRRIIVNMANTD